MVEEEGEVRGEEMEDGVEVGRGRLVGGRGKEKRERVWSSGC